MRRALLLIALFSLGACKEAERSRRASSAARPASSAQPAEIAAALATLRTEEAAILARTDFARRPPSSRALGPNPYAIVGLTGAPWSNAASGVRYAALLRGDSRLVLLNDALAEVASLPAPRSPHSLAVAPGGRLYVVGELERRVARYVLRAGQVVEEAPIPAPSVTAPRAVAVDQRALVLADFGADALGALPLGAATAGEPPALAVDVPTCRGPFRLALGERFLGVLCLFDHALSLVERDDQGLPAREAARITHDGPFWGFSLLESQGGVLVALGGVEDRPLDRRDKVFGYVDSFVYLYRLEPGRPPSRLFAVNTSALGVLTPKVLKLEERDQGFRLTVFGYGSDKGLELRFDARGPAEPRVTVVPSIPGCSDAAPRASGFVCANPLLDAFVELAGVPVLHAARPPEPRDPNARERLGEALFFTNLMAPDASSDGRLSRFTCETCHFEGGTDGRVHHSGRDDIRVSTRPLFGLLNGAPHFSRAHDRDLTAVCHNEFTVANRGNPVDPWFTLRTDRFPFLASAGVVDSLIAPLDLRRALLAFLSRFSHEENPSAARTGSRFTDRELAGAHVFRERCAGCHAARLIATDPTTAVPFERWPERVLSPEGPIVWSRGEYARTGVLPYVDPKGTRIPSLRRLYLKRPYLTRGSAPTLGELLSAVRFSDGEFLHAGGEARGDMTALEPDERARLLDFLRLL